MKYKVLFLFTFLLLILHQTPLLAQKGYEKWDPYFTSKMKKAHVLGLQAASIQDGELVWQGSYGLREYKSNKKVNDSTLFMIASSTKPVTALGVLLLKEKGKLDLDEPVNSYLPFEIKNPNYPESPITPRMLLSHTSSLNDNWDVLEPLYTLPEGGDSPLELQYFVREYFSEGGEYFDAEANFHKVLPASKFDYCNMGYVILGLVIEQISGQAFEDFMKEEVFLPLSMHNSYWFLRDIPHQNIARPHRIHPSPKKAPREPEMLNHYGYADFPDGQLRTTVSDYARFINLLLNEGKVNGKAFIQPSTVQEFIRIQYPEVAKHQAIAWNYNEFDNFIYYLLMPRLPSHTGADPGVATVVSFNPKKRSAAIIFSNSPTITFKGQKIFYQEMVKKLLQ